MSFAGAGERARKFRTAPQGLLSTCWFALLWGLSFARSFNASTFGALVCANFFCLGGNFSLFPRGTAEEFGSEAVGKGAAGRRAVFSRERVACRFSTDCGEGWR